MSWHFSMCTFFSTISKHMYYSVIIHNLRKHSSIQYILLLHYYYYYNSNSSQLFTFYCTLFFTVQKKITFYIFYRNEEDLILTTSNKYINLFYFISYFLELFSTLLFPVPPVLYIPFRIKGFFYERKRERDIQFLRTLIWHNVCTIVLKILNIFIKQNLIFSKNLPSWSDLFSQLLRNCVNMRQIDKPMLSKYIFFTTNV